MATILLQAAGAWLGGAFGTVGTAIGSAAGALAGYVLDRGLIASTQRIEGPKLAGARPFTAEEGAAIPRVYGAARMGGLLIWATRFEEAGTTTRQGFKGGPRVTEYSYFANVAFALCEGEIAGVRRIWADGKEIDRTQVEIRVYRGTQTQMPDPLIEAKQGIGNAPAYRGTAYIVFDRLPLADYGNRVPQLQFEVLRPVGTFHSRIRGVSLIPGATEYGLSTGQVTREVQPGETVSLNRHVLHAGSDIAASLDELQMLCPNLERVALVTTWFGDDLRAGVCTVRPKVTASEVSGLSQAWKVSGLERAEALEVSQHDGGAAYGGTPSDRSVLDAIAEIKSRGLKVTLYPFLMMDVPAGNGLPDPHGASEQAAYPWRGRISCYPGEADKTAAARAQVATFRGTATAGQFSAAADTVAFAGTEWSYRRFILHYANLAEMAGGVDAFLIGSELRGLTTLRDGADAFPFVEALCALAGDVRAILGSGAEITYGADWSEYFGHQPPDGSGDVFFHLDALWMHPAIDAVGIDNYMPVSDWRDADYGGGNPDGFTTPYDLKGMTAGIAGGEGFDWYYASGADRASRLRTPITDGLGKPWTFRYKDLVGWWSNVHHDRPGGVEQSAPTAWVPKAKPLWLTELGCPAVDKGPNQPNVFPDPKSAESAAPYWSNGGRSDAAQRRFLEAHQDWWDDASPEFSEARNPVSTIYGGRMLDIGQTLVWAWDARPFPAFPLRDEEWSDGRNWQLGHWLGGRLESPSVGDLINAILADQGLPPANVREAEGSVQGYVLQDPTTARAALEPIIDLFGLAVREESGQLVISNGNTILDEVTVGAISVDSEPALETVRMPDHDLPREAMLALREPLLDYQATAPKSRRQGVSGNRQQVIGFPGSLDFGQGQALLDDWLTRVWVGREQVTFSVAPSEVAFEAGAVIALPERPDARFRIESVEQGLLRKVTARRFGASPPTPWRKVERISGAPASPILVGKPDVHFLDLPMIADVAPETRLRVAAWQKPWKRQAVQISAGTSGYEMRTVIGRQAIVGRLVQALPAGGYEGRIDPTCQIVVRLSASELASVSRLQLLNGANAAAVKSLNGSWEVIQFELADEIEVGVWRLTRLLRGQAGTEPELRLGAASGSPFVFLDDAVIPAGLTATEIGLPRNWRVSPAGLDTADVFEASVMGGVRSRLPLSPAHLSARRNADGDVLLNWVRRTRIGGDDWEQSDVPLGEAVEQYRVEIAPAGGGMLRTVEVGASAWLYPAADVVSDFGSIPDTLDLTVAQFSAVAGYGLPEKQTIHIN